MMLRITILLIVSTATFAVDRSIYKTCSQVDFCSQLRSLEKGYDYSLDLDSIDIDDHFFSAKLTSPVESDLYLNVFAIKGGIARISIRDNSGRYHVQNVVQSELFSFVPIDEYVVDNMVYLLYENHGLRINSNPFWIEFYENDGNLFLGLNLNNKFLYNTNDNESFAFDVTFPNATHAYGIPEHADHLALRRTDNDTDPYRLYNLDVAYYELESTMALYGSVPVLYGHGPNVTAGIFLLNAAEQWIDIDYANDMEGVDVHFIVESGVFDLFVLMGPTPREAVVQYSALTGVAPLPPLWSLGYHQSRWNYWTQEEVKEVSNNFNNSNLPLDAVWLDIEYTDNKKYFTWDSESFSDPIEMQESLAALNRKLVTILDPHIKVDEDYFVYNQSSELGIFVKTYNNSDFKGDCWPGLSSYLDFLHPVAYSYWGSLFNYTSFNGSTPVLAGIWNDMNEPSVFDDTLEKTFPKDNRHYLNISHRDIHNMYGFLQTRATYGGLLNRDDPQVRPFILTRSHFAGSQRFTAIWTGDNTADWGYLAASYSMCLTEALAGISFCGADVGGFFNNPNAELLERWYQAGIWLPFFRAHSNQDTNRREPYLFNSTVQANIRTALNQRYAHLPVWYTVFFEHYRTGEPVIRPVFYEYPQDRRVYDIEDQLFVGSNILVKAITEPGVTSTDFYFPGGAGQNWYDIYTPLMYPGTGWMNISVDDSRVPMYYKGGSIIPKQTFPVGSSAQLKDQAYVVYIILDYNETATGTLYIDDNTSFNYQNGTYNYYSFNYEVDNIQINTIQANYPDVQLNVDRYVVYMPPSTGTTRSDGPVVPKTKVFTHAADGTKIRDIKYTHGTSITIKLM